MNVGFFTFDFFPYIGGQGRYIHSLYTGFLKMDDINFYVFSPNKNNLLNHVKVFSISKKILNSFLFSFLLNINIKKLIKKYNLDIINVSGGPGGLFLWRKVKVPVIYTEYHTYYQQYSLVPGQRYKKILYYIEKHCLNRANYIISISEATKKTLIEHYSISAEKIRKIYIQIPIKKKEIKRNNKKIKNSLLYLGRLAPRKGILFLIDSIRLAKIKVPGIKLYLIGTGPLRNKITQLINENKLEENIKLLGFVEDEELARWYQKVDLCVIPSEFEGFGMTVVEAMIYGKPIIATNVHGINEIIKNGENGSLLEYGDKEGLAKKIVEYLSNREMLQRYAKASLNSLSKWTNVQSMLNEIKEAYRSVLNGNSQKKS